VKCIGAPTDLEDGVQGAKKLLPKVEPRAWDLLAMRPTGQGRWAQCSRISLYAMQLHCISEGGMDSWRQGFLAPPALMRLLFLEQDLCFLTGAVLLKEYGGPGRN
jgi:hypothetical protein